MVLIRPTIARSADEVNLQISNLFHAPGACLFGGWHRAIFVSHPKSLNTEPTCPPLNSPNWRAVPIARSVFPVPPSCA